VQSVTPNEERVPDVEEAGSDAQPDIREPEEPLTPSAFELVRRVVVGMVQAIEDGADLLGASVREELARFRTDLVRAVIAACLLAAGGGLLTAGLAMLMNAWMGSWPPVLLLLGGVYLGLGIWLFTSSSAGTNGDS